MLERYSHVRMEAKRAAMITLASITKKAGYDTNHDSQDFPNLLYVLVGFIVHIALLDVGEGVSLM